MLKLATLVVLSFITNIASAGQFSSLMTGNDLIAKVRNLKSFHRLLQDHKVELMRPINEKENIFVIRLGEQLTQPEIQDIFVYLEDNKTIMVPKPRPNHLISSAPMSKTLMSSEDPLLPQQWALPDADVISAWNVTEGDRRVVVALIDSGIDYNHPDLIDNIWTNKLEAGAVHGYNFVANNNDPMDDLGHGTHCAGIIGAVHGNGIGIAGVMGKVSLMALKFVDSTGTGKEENAIRAIDYAIKMKADVISASWASEQASNALKDAIQRANAAGILFVAAAGNDTVFPRDNDFTSQFPANYNLPNLISVASIDSDDRLSYYSHFGRTSVWIAAPGRDILSTLPGNKFGLLSGTSMATPMVTGAIGLLLAKEGKLPPSEVKERLRRTSVFSKELRKKVVANGRLDVHSFLTNTDGPRPVLEGWKPYRLSTPIESKHPYGPNQIVRLPVKIPGAKYIRAKISRIELLNGDWFQVHDAKGLLVDKIGPGSSIDRYTDYIEGDLMILSFSSDSWGSAGWGFRVEEVEYL